ncbi:MAG: hypothetical protein KGM96_08770 [Acidobacteriota bacterium]|nr:hypothetical protein [Acidobacteriota bacterium]
MSDQDRPPLPAIMYELIEDQLRKIDERHEQSLLAFSVNPAVAPGKRAPAKQPRKLMNALEVYASNLFVAEVAQYGEFERDESYSRWLIRLKDRIIARIFETIALVEQRPDVQLSYHGLTVDEMRAGLNSLLMRAANEYSWKASRSPVQIPAQPVQLEAPQVPLGNRERIEQFIQKMALAGLKIKRKDIWKAAGYADRTEFERFQRGDGRNKAASMAFNRILSLASEDFQGFMKPTP